MFGFGGKRWPKNSGGTPSGSEKNQSVDEKEPLREKPDQIEQFGEGVGAGNDLEGGKRPPFNPRGAGAEFTEPGHFEQEESVVGAESGALFPPTQETPGAEEPRPLEDPDGLGAPGQTAGALSEGSREAQQARRGPIAESEDEAVGEIAGGESAEAKPWQSNLRARRKGQRLVKPENRPRPVTGEQRVWLLDMWERSAIPGSDFAALVGISRYTLYAWKKKFETEGPAGLLDKPRGARKGSRLPDLTRRTIVMLKEANPDWGCQRISDMLVRGPGISANPQAVARVLKEAGYEREEIPTRPHPDHVRHFERAKPNQLWQTDLFTFMLKRQNRRVYLVAFMDDHSRFIVGYGLYASPATALVLEVVRAAFTSYGTPEEILTDNGTQYVTWRGKSAFTKELEKRGIRQIVAAPRHPRTLGKIERFWGSLWRECLESAVFIDLADAQRRIGLYIDHHNFLRPHQGIEGLVPADRFFQAAPEVLRTLQARVQANALALAQNGMPKTPFYLTGQVAGQPFSVHAEGERVILTRAGEARQEIDLVAPASALACAERVEGVVAVPTLPQPVCPMGEVQSSRKEAGTEKPPAPGTSPLDEGLRQMGAALDALKGGQP